MKILSKFIAGFNRLDSRILIFIILSIFFLGFELIYNEEHYFGYAKAFMDPEWIPGSFLFTDFPGTRIVFQYITGWALRFISFEQLAFFGRMLNFLLYAFPVAALARHFRLNNILLVFWLAVIFIPQQSFFAGEWMFGGFESKTIAYVFVLWSIYFFFKNRFLVSILLAGLSIYWHLLVGGWYSIYLFIFFLLKYKMNIKMVSCWFIYAIILSPLLIYIYKGMVSGNPTIINGVNTGEVYTFIRNPSHIGLFKSREFFLRYHAGKIFISLVAFILSLTLYRKSAPAHLKEMNTLLIIILIQNLSFVIIAYFDRKGAILKFYPFRGSLLAMLFFQLETLLLLKEKWIPQFYRWLKMNKLKWYKRTFYQAQMIFLFCLFLLTISLKLINRYDNIKRNRSIWSEINSLSACLKQNSAPSDKFMMLCEETHFTLTIPRKSERDAYFYHRFIPTESKGIYEWYIRMNKQGQVKAQPEVLIQPGFIDNVAFVIACSTIENEYFKPLFRSEHYRIYKIIRYFEQPIITSSDIPGR
jgi:hypothetical protein